LQNTIFLSYELRNKSENDYQDFRFGFFSDFELGYAYDDYVGCDTTLNLSYVYNAYEIDGNGEPGEYGENPPAQGCMFLNKKMSVFMYFNNDSYSPIEPSSRDYYDYMRAIWRDGVPLTYGGNGYKESTKYTNYAFSGDPVAGTGWTELTPRGPGSRPNMPYDRRGVMCNGPFTFSAGETFKVDIALPFAQANGNLASVALLQQRAAEIQRFYDEHMVDVKENDMLTGKLWVYPNPSNGQFTITGEKGIETVELYDMLGKKVFSSTPKVQTVQINTHLPQGLYMYRAVLDDYSICTGKILVQ